MTKSSTWSREAFLEQPLSQPYVAQSSEALALYQHCRICLSGKCLTKLQLALHILDASPVLSRHASHNRHNEEHKDHCVSTYMTQQPLLIGEQTAASLASPIDTMHIDIHQPSKHNAMQQPCISAVLYTLLSTSRVVTSPDGFLIRPCLCSLVCLGTPFP